MKTNTNYINIRTIINMTKKNIYKLENALLIMGKKGVGVTLDKDVVEAIEGICKNSRGAKFSPVVNSLLKEHPEVKKLLNKLKRKNGNSKKTNKKEK